jgi:hypothetical protein
MIRTLLAACILSDCGILYNFVLVVYAMTLQVLCYSIYKYNYSIAVVMLMCHYDHVRITSYVPTPKKFCIQNMINSVVVLWDRFAIILFHHESFMWLRYTVLSTGSALGVLRIIIPCRRSLFTGHIF